MPVPVRASLWFLICSFLQKGISVITTPIFTRLMSTAEYGQYNVFNSWLSIVTIFVTLRLTQGVFTQGLVKFDGEQKVFASSMQGLGLTLCAVWAVIYFVFKDFWNRLLDLTTVQMLGMLVMIWATEAFAFWAAEQRVKYKYRRLVLITILVSVAKPLVGIILVINSEDKVTARILGLALVELVGYTGLFCVQMFRGKTFFSKKFWLYSLKFNLPLVPHYLSQTVLSSSDRIMIKDLVGKSEAGIYGLAYSISLIMTMFNTALSHTISPWIYQKIKAKQTDDIAGVAYISLFSIAAVNLFLIIFAPEAVAIFAPAKYRDAIWVIPPVAMSVFFTCCYDLFAKFEFYYEKTAYIMTASVLGAVLNIILNYIFIRIFGYVAAAYTTLFCYIIYSVAHYLFMRRVCRKYLDNVKVYDLKILLGMSVGFVALGFIFLLTYKVRIVRYAVAAIMIAAVIIKRKYIVSKVKLILNIRKKKA